MDGPMSQHTALVNETRIRVRYAETDQMGVVYHANHFISVSYTHLTLPTILRV